MECVLTVADNLLHRDESGIAIRMFPYLED